MSATQTTGSAGRWGPRWGARAREWAAIEDQQRPTYEEALRRIDVGPGRQLLDVGCGSGAFLRLAADRGAEVFGLDASEALLAEARMRLPDADLRSGDMESLPYDDGFFDVVTGFNSFFFAADMVAALREARRVAKPGAPVIVQVWGRPEQCDLDAHRTALASFLPPADPSAPKLWQEGVLERIAEAAGLTPVERFETNWAFSFGSDDELVRALLSPGVVTLAIEAHGEEPVRAAILAALAPYRSPDGGYRLENEWHFLVTRA